MAQYGTPGPQQRLYGMMQHLLTHFAHSTDPGVAGDRGIVTAQDALDAVVFLAAALDEPAQAGQIDQNRAFYMGALLMVIREYIRPLPEGLDETGAGPDLATADLRAMVDAIRQAPRP